MELAERLTCCASFSIAYRPPAAGAGPDQTSVCGDALGSGAPRIEQALIEAAVSTKATLAEVSRDVDSARPVVRAGSTIRPLINAVLSI